MEKGIMKLIELAEKEGDHPTGVILNALLGAKHSGMDILLANKVADFVQDVLLPATIRDQNERKASMN